MQSNSYSSMNGTNINAPVFTPRFNAPVFIPRPLPVVPEVPATPERFDILEEAEAIRARGPSVTAAFIPRGTPSSLPLFFGAEETAERPP